MPRVFLAGVITLHVSLLAHVSCERRCEPCFGVSPCNLIHLRFRCFSAAPGASAALHRFRSPVVLRFCSAPVNCRCQHIDMSGRDPLASPAPRVLGGSRQRSVAADMATASQGTPPTQPKVSLSIKDAKLDTPLTPATATVWFRRVLVACETLLCETALTDASAPDHAQ
jgi:hypothetical protein